MRRRLLPLALLILPLLGTSFPTRGEDSGSLSPRSGSAIQPDQRLPSVTKQEHCNPGATYCQLPRRDVGPADSDLNKDRASGQRLEDQSSLNGQSRTGAQIQRQSP